MMGLPIRNFSEAQAADDVHYNGGVPYDSNGALLVDSVSSQEANTFDLFGDSISQYITTRKTISSLTRSGTTATAVCTAHGLNSGWHNVITESLTDDLYTGRVNITRVDANTFTYTVSASAPATAGAAVVLQPQRRTDVNWFDWANFRLGGRMRLGRNLARAGRTADNMLDATGLVAESPSRNVIVELGRNDITGAKPIDEIVDDLTSILRAFVAIGKKVWVLTIPPVESGHSAFSVSNANRERQVNEWLRWFVRSDQNSNMVLVDVAALTVDPTSTTGSARANYLTEYVHPAPICARLAYGEALYQAAVDQLPPVPLLPSSALDEHTLNRQTLTSVTQSAGVATATLTSHGYLEGEYVYVYGGDQTGYRGRVLVLSVPTSGTFTYAVDSATVSPGTGTFFVTASNALGNNPTMLGTGGNTTGTVGTITETDDIPDGVTVTATANAACTVTVVARSDGVGNDLVLTCTATAAATSVTAKSTNSMHNRCQMGETIYAVCALNVSGMTAVKAISFNLQATIDSVVYVSEPWSNGGLAAAQFAQTDTGDLVIVTPDFELPNGSSMTALTWNLQISFDANPAAAVAKLGRVMTYAKLPYF